MLPPQKSDSRADTPSAHVLPRNEVSGSVVFFFYYLNFAVNTARRWSEQVVHSLLGVRAARYNRTQVATTTTELPATAAAGTANC